MDLIEHLAKLSTAVTARVLRNMADALDAQPASDPVPPLVIHVENYHHHEAPSRLFGKAR